MMLYCPKPFDKNVQKTSGTVCLKLSVVYYKSLSDLLLAYTSVIYPLLYTYTVIILELTNPGPYILRNILIESNSSIIISCNVVYSYKEKKMVFFW